MRCGKNKNDPRGGQCKREAAPNRKWCEYHLRLNRKAKKRWRKKSPEVAKLQDKRYREKYRDKLNLRKSIERMRDPQKLREQGRRSYRRHREARLEYYRAYRANHKREKAELNFKYKLFRSNRALGFWQNLMKGEVVENKLD